MLFVLSIIKLKIKTKKILLISPISNFIVDNANNIVSEYERIPIKNIILELY